MKSMKSLMKQNDTRQLNWITEWEAMYCRKHGVTLKVSMYRIWYKK